MEKAIKKAIEGGYPPPTSMHFSKQRTKARILLDPLFWQALGKAEKWEDTPLEYDETFWHKQNDAHGNISIIDRSINEWHSFIDHLANSGDAESFFKELLA